METTGGFCFYIQMIRAYAGFPRRHTSQRSMLTRHVVRICKLDCFQATPLTRNSTSLPTLPGRRTTCQGCSEPRIPLSLRGRYIKISVTSQRCSRAKDLGRVKGLLRRLRFPTMVRGGMRGQVHLSTRPGLSNGDSLRVTASLFLTGWFSDVVTKL